MLELQPLPKGGACMFVPDPKLGQGVCAAKKNIFWGGLAILFWATGCQ